MRFLGPVQTKGLCQLCEGCHRCHDFDVGCPDCYWNDVSSGGSDCPAAKNVVHIVHMKRVSIQYLLMSESVL